MEIKTFVLGSGSNFGYFTTVDADGTPITLAGTPSLACNINGGAAATAGLTLVVDSGSVTGRHRVAVDVDNVTLALADGDSVDVYLAAGTVDAVSVVGQSVLKFIATDGSLLPQTEADINAQVDLAISDAALATAAALATVDANVDAILVDTAEIGAAGAGLTEAGGTGDQLTALATAAALATVDSNVDAILVDTGTTLQAELDGIQADTEDIQSRLPAALNNGAIVADVQRINDVAITGDGQVGTEFSV